VWLASVAGGTLADGTNLDPRQTVESVTAQLREALVREREAIDADPERLITLVDSLLAPHADFDAMSAWVLGRFWRQADADQRERFKRAFRRLLVRTYATAVRHIENADINYLPERDTGKPKTAVVRTEVTPADSQLVAIDYYMHARNGPWQVYDLRIEGISLIASYRSSYASQIQSDGLNQLIAAIEAKAADGTEKSP
jgi:phospholipid transport system substrate-binding protein